jgi:hypothetical protein
MLVQPPSPHTCLSLNQAPSVTGYPKRDVVARRLTLNFARIRLGLIGGVYAPMPIASSQARHPSRSSYDRDSALKGDQNDF